MGAELGREIVVWCEVKDRNSSKKIEGMIIYKVLHFATNKWEP